MTSMIRFDPFGEFSSLRRAMDRVFDDFGRGGWRGSEAELTFPIDLFETEDSVTVKAVLPGINPEDVEISVSEGVLTVKGESRLEQTSERENYYRQEIRYGAFSRSIPLPSRVNHEQAEAKFKDGVLMVTLPKAEEVRPKQIKIKPDTAQVDSGSDRSAELTSAQN
jgi:HSP20 family protein